LRGDLIHLLLQRLPALPADQRARAGAALAATSGLDGTHRAEALATALELMQAPRWAALFSGEARAEVDIAGRIPVAGRMEDVAGRIDRLLITPQRVTVLDYKTGRPPQHLTNVPKNHLRQMAAYRALVQDLYPDREVETAILWTAIPTIAILAAAELDRALLELA
jgi:ATP-dependent helicase/nuclease subunit A